MPIRISRPGDGGDRSGTNLWTLLTSKVFARRWLGKVAPPLPGLPLPAGDPVLLYFRTRGCTVCDLIDMQVAAACHKAGVNLVIVDRYAKSDAPEDQAIYAEPTNILDFGGAINRAYGIGVYPSLVLIDQAGKIVLKDVGSGQAPAEKFGEYLGGRLRALL